ncbi:HigA family addiction module antitoxin [Brevundimonas sp.]|uniref:HigA family addiction module antitoxin n=1 Tax=Brevundimonas sp. TaxID=1871086 RepID=UPI003F71E2A6
MIGRDHTTFAEPLAHPGAHLREDFLPDYGLTPGALARAMGLKDRTRIERVVREQQPVTSDTALRLARVFGTTAEFWMNLQTQHDLSRAAIAGSWGRRRRGWATRPGAPTGEGLAL